MTSLSTMVLKKTGKVAKDVLLAQWNWISGKDINENSRIFIGNKVNIMYVWLARAAVLGVLVAAHSPIVTKLKGIQKHIKDILEARIDFFQDKHELGATTAMQFNRFLSSSWNVFFDMVRTCISVTTGFVNIITVLAGQAGDGANSIGLELAIIFEKILIGKSVMAMKNSNGTATLGTLSFFLSVSIFSFLESKVVGFLAYSSEYIYHRATPTLTDENMDLLLRVASVNPTMEMVPFTEKYEFTNNAYDIDDQFKKEILFGSWKTVLRGSSRLGDAIRAAKIYKELTGSRELITNNSNPRERTSVTGGVRRRGGRAKSRSRMKACAHLTRDNERCTNQTSNRYCRQHRNRGLEPKKIRFADKTLLVF